jgi:RNA polymerase sigma-70 factor, ECF subfamily
VSPSGDPNDLLGRSLSSSDLPSHQASMELLERARGGDRVALEDLIERYQDRLQRIVRIRLRGSMLRRHMDSMDLVQDTFQAALPRIADLHPRNPAGLLHWLTVIAMNRIRDTYASFKTGMRDTDREVELGEGARHELSAGVAQPDEQALLAEVREMLDEAVAGLPDDQRQVVLLRDYIGEDWDRIAAELGRENGATRQLHQRAWIRLRQALGPRLRGAV